MIKIVVFGADGQLGKSLQSIQDTFSAKWIFFNKQDCDFLVSGQIDQYIRSHKPDYVINAAAYTAVDQAEENYAQCLRINGLAVEEIARAAEFCNATLIHISSDYVYHSINNAALRESDPCRPASVYARSKLMADQWIKKITKKHIILRCSWVYSEFGKNFVHTMLHLGRTKDQLNIVSDQTGTPTYARDIALTVVKILQKLELDPGPDDIYGIYNYSSTGRTNWAEFADVIFAKAQIDCKVVPISTKSYGAPAGRPAWSVMDISKINSLLSVTPRSWEDALDDCLSRISS